MRKISRDIISIALAAFILFVPRLAFSQETFTLTTYFPAPYGTYSSLRLFPRTDFSSGEACANPGELRFQVNDHMLYFCDGSSATWIPFGGGLWKDGSTGASSEDLCAQPIQWQWKVGIGTSQAEAKLDVRGEGLIFKRDASATVYGMDMYVKGPFDSSNIDRTVHLQDGSDNVGWNLFEPASDHHLYFNYGTNNIAQLADVPAETGQLTATGLVIGGLPENNYWLRVHGKFRAKNIFAQSIPVSCASTSGICSTTVTFPAGAFSAAPATLCSAGPHMRGPSASDPYVPIMCSVSGVTATGATITIGTNRSDVHFDGDDKLIELIAWQY